MYPNTPQPLLSSSYHCFSIFTLPPHLSSQSPVSPFFFSFFVLLVLSLITQLDSHFLSTLPPILCLPRPPLAILIVIHNY